MQSIPSKGENARVNAREQENLILEKCVAAASGTLLAATNREEANVFRLAAIVVRSRYPDYADRVAGACDLWFEKHPHDKLPSDEVIRSGWVISMPRLRDMLNQRLSEIKNDTSETTH